MKRAHTDGGFTFRQWAARILAGAVFATVVGIGLAYRFRASRNEQPPTLPQKLPGNADQQLSDYSFTRSDEGREVFTIHAARTLNLKRGGPAVLEDVVVQIFGQKGARRDLLRTQHAEYDPRSGDFTTQGRVEIELNAQTGGGSSARLEGSEPVYVETSNIFSRRQGMVLSTDELVKFRAGPLSGSARGMVYAPKDAWLELKKDVRAELQPVTQAGQDAVKTAGAQSAHQPALAATESATTLGPATGQNWRGTTRVAPPLFKPAGGAGPPVLTQLTASRLRYEKQTGQVTLWGPLEIRQGSGHVRAATGQVSLNAQGRTTQVLLTGDVQAHGTVAEGRPTRQSRRSLMGSEGEARAETTLTAKAQRVRGDFDPATGRLCRVVANGAVHAESHQGAASRDRPPRTRASHGQLDAERLEIIFKGLHAEAERGTASGHVELRAESPGSSARSVIRRAAPASADNPSGTAGDAEPKTRILKASQIEFSFHPGGRSLSRLTTVGAGELDLLAGDANLGRRAITAGQLLMEFDPQNRPERLVGLQGAHIISERGLLSTPPATKAESSSDRLEAMFEPLTGELKTLEQVGNFRFTEGERQGSAEKALYSARTQEIALTGHPEVWDPLTRMRADGVLLHLATDTAEGIGRVQSTHFEQASRTVSATEGARLKTGDRQGLPGSDVQQSAAIRTINVLADRVSARRRDQFVHYQGHVRAWRGPDVIESSSLDYYGKEQRLSTASPVLTSHLAPLENGPASASAAARNVALRRPAPRPLTIRADGLELLYENRKASYRGNVQLQTEDTVLRADRMTVYFSPRPSGRESQIDHAVADGHVVATQPGRGATGEHGEYFAGQGKVVLRGGSPTLYDEKRGSTTGQSLTFFIHDDRLLVDGGDQSPTLSKHRITQ